MQFIRASVLILVSMLTGCVSAPQSTSLLSSASHGLESQVRLTHVPFFPQEDFQCGPAALATMLSAAGLMINPEELVDDVYVPGKHGSYQLELITATRTHGRLPYRIAPSLETLLKEVQANNPVLVLQNLGLEIAPQWHFAVVKGYDLQAESILLNSGTIEDYQMPLKVFERTWQRAEHWAIVVTPPGILPSSANPNEFFDSLTALEHSDQSTPALTRYYQTAVMQWPDNTNLQMGYGNLNFAKHDFVAAEQVFRQLAMKQPDFAPAFNNLAFTLYSQGKLQEALKYAKKALELGGEFNTRYAETFSMITDALSEP